MTEGQLRFVAVSLDCADPDELGTFYQRLLTGEVLWAKPSSVGVRVPGLVIVAQRVDGYVPPSWPGSSIVHLDLSAGADLRTPEALALSLGATLVDPQVDPRWRVLLDPAGHPFCITSVGIPGGK